MKNTTTLIALSENAKTLFDLLVKTGGAWEDDLAKMLFKKPEYIGGGVNADFWQWEVNMYGSDREMNGVIYTQNVEVPYRSQVSAAYQELRRAGMAGERNSGYNDYWFYPIKP